MKAILEFNLPEDNDEFKTVNQASSLLSTIHDIDNYLRNRIKYNENSTEVENTLQEVRDKLNELLLENNIDIW